MAQSLREMHTHWQNPPRPKIFAREILSRFARAVQIETERPRSASALQKNRVTDVRHRNRTLASRLSTLSRLRLPGHPGNSNSVGRGQLADLFDRAQPDGARLRRTIAIRSDDGLHVAGRPPP